MMMSQICKCQLPDEKVRIACDGKVQVATLLIATLRVGITKIICFLCGSKNG